MSITSAFETGRRLLTATLLDRCGIMDRTQVADGTGGMTQTYVARSSDTACRFVKLMEGSSSTGAKLTDQSGSMEGYASMSLLLDLDVELSELSKVWAADGRAFLVVGNETPPSVLATVQRALLRELGVSA